jgi:hypothetical protein
MICCGGLRERNNLENLDIDGMIIFKRISKKWGEDAALD